MPNQEKATFKMVRNIMAFYSPLPHLLPSMVQHAWKESAQSPVPSLGIEGAKWNLFEMFWSVCAYPRNWFLSHLTQSSDGEWQHSLELGLKAMKVMVGAATCENYRTSDLWMPGSRRLWAKVCNTISNVP